MKKIIFILCIFPAFTIAQETVKKRSSDYNMSEEYYVLKSDKKIKHGSYKKYGFGNYVLIEGFYKNDLRDSAWIEYWSPPYILKSKGSYTNGERVGVWEFYNRIGVLEQKYDYTTKQLLYDQSIEKNQQKIYRVISGTDTIKTKLQTPPVYIGGRTRLQSATGKGFTIPPKATNRDMAGNVLVSFIIDTTGKASNQKIFSGLGNVFDDEALKMVKQIPDNWIPGVLNGVPVNVEYVLTIDFRNFGN